MTAERQACREGGVLPCRMSACPWKKLRRLPDGQLEIWGDTELIRMISARPATGKEREDYEAGLHK